MKYRTRTYYTDSQKALMWERWKAGDSLQQIAQLFDRSHSSVEGILSRTGGIPPPERCRSSLALTLAEREEISRAVVAGFSVRAIASILGRAPSTVSREIKRNGGREGYRAAQADQAAWDRGHRPKRCKLWQGTEPWRASWLPSSNRCGRLSRSRGGSSIVILATRTSRCHTRPSIAASLSKPVGP